MKLALDLARRGIGRTNTNPMVGCVIVKNGKVIGKGHHKEFGGPHAEVFALKESGKAAEGATVYVTLEPCISFEGKKTPPCASALVNAGVKEVFISMRDPNPAVSGKGIAFLKRKGVIVHVGLLEQEANQLNAHFIKFSRTKKPFVFLKVAMSLDQKIACPGRRYFSGKESLKFAHQLRSKSDAILVGIGTVLKDDPALTTRLVKGKDPLRVILDDELKIPLNAKVLADTNVLVACSKTKFDPARKKALETRGYSIVLLPEKHGHLDLNRMLLELGKMNIGTLMVEGGSKIIASFFGQQLFDKCYFVVVPEIFGKTATPLLSEPLKTKFRLSTVSITKLGKDLLFETIPIYGA